MEKVKSLDNGASATTKFPALGEGQALEERSRKL